MTHPKPSDSNASDEHDLCHIHPPTGDTFADQFQQLVYQEPMTFNPVAKDLVIRYCKQASYGEWQAQEVMIRLFRKGLLPADLKDWTPEQIVRAILAARGSLTREGQDVLIEMQKEASDNGAPPTPRKRPASEANEGGELPFTGRTVEELDVTIRIDCVNVKLMDTRGFGTDFSWGALSVRYSGSIHHTLQELGISKTAKNLIPWPATLTESTKSRFNEKFRQVTGASGDLLSKKGGTLFSNAGKMSWSEETGAMAREERSNQQERIDRTGKMREDSVYDEEEQLGDPFFEGNDEGSDEPPGYNQKPPWERDHM